VVDQVEQNQAWTRLRAAVHEELPSDEPATEVHLNSDRQHWGAFMSDVYHLKVTCKGCGWSWDIPPSEARMGKPSWRGLKYLLDSYAARGGPNQGGYWTYPVLPTYETRDPAGWQKCPNCGSIRTKSIGVLPSKQTVQFNCPNCQSPLQVDEGTTKATCPHCDKLIMWRRCLETNQTLPVLSEWTAWTHPGCNIQHEGTP
jgi:predicted RNA-binding Zn-ribbon protein involved in translation (DUF1610 family)